MIKKIIILITFLLTPLYAQAVEEVILEKESINLDYFSKVYYGEIEENVSPILKLFSQNGLCFENSKINSIKATFLFDSRFSINSLAHSKTSLIHDFATIEPMLTVKFNNNKTKFMIDYNLLRDLDGYSNSFTEKISRLYISHAINENQTILFGQGGRIPNSYDGKLGTMEQELVLRSQLGRTFGDIRSTGIRNIAKYEFIDYDIGLYDSTRYMKDFGNGLDFTSNIMLKPFNKSNEKIKNFKVGGAYSIGNNNQSYSTYSFFAGYDYKNFHIHTEYAYADGYNGIKKSRNNADGFYTLLSYNITPKLTILGRYDYFVKNKDYTHSYCQEYTAGITYKIFKNMSLMFNFVNRNYSNQKDANMILFATRFII